MLAYLSRKVKIYQPDYQIALLRFACDDNLHRNNNSHRPDSTSSRDRSPAKNIRKECHGEGMNDRSIATFCLLLMTC